MNVTFLSFFVHTAQVMTDSLPSCVAGYISCTFSHMLTALGNHFSWCQLPLQSLFCWNLTSHFSYAAATGLSLSYACNCYPHLMQHAASCSTVQKPCCWKLPYKNVSIIFTKILITFMSIMGLLALKR